MTSEPEFSFGRVAVPDARDGLYPMRAVLGPETARTGKKIWPTPHAALDQGQEGTCVGHGWKHFLLTEPFVQAGPAEDPTAVGIYDRCTQIDEFAQNDNGDRNFGTSVRSGAKVLLERKLVAEYRHAQSMADIIDWVLDKGTVVIGCDWYAGMMYRSQWDGNFLVPTGELKGGHCVLIQGVDTEYPHNRGNAAYPKGTFLIRNSWGKTWGPMSNGTANISVADMDLLIFQRGGDALATLEIALGPTPPPPPEPPPPTPPEPEKPVFHYPYQQVLTLAEARTSGIFDMVDSPGELIYLFAVKTDRAGTRIAWAQPLYGAKFEGKLENGTLDDPSLAFFVQRVQAKHRPDWNA